jgi:hypothetical protein
MIRMNKAAPAQATAHADGSRPEPPGTRTQPDQPAPATMPGSEAAPPEPVLPGPEAERRTLLLGELQAALAKRGVRAVVARHHRLALNSAGQDYSPSGLTDPCLHIFAPDATRKAITDTAVYRLDNGDQYPVSDPARAAAAICGQQAHVTA